MNTEVKSSFKVMTLAALGVVFGDIGTSPLYAFKEAFNSSHYNLAPDEANVLGVLSLIFWSITLIVTIKYVYLVLRVDNHGEGGVVALMARLTENKSGKHNSKVIVIVLGLMGAALFYGDGVITPAISVLSAVEGLEFATPAFKPYIVPITLAILTGLFVLQKFGTAKVGALFGPIVLVWFFILAILGLWHICEYPKVLNALSPWYGLKFFISNMSLGFLVLSAVFLTVTGGEALYADMGHFGLKPIKFAWLFVVFPSLILNYFGQGALVLKSPESVSNPFFKSVPEWGVVPMVILATFATVIASQALITGAFSITRELMQLGYCPRLSIKHTSGENMGQIYIPFINWLLLILVISIVLGFRSSSNLAAAYGIAVTITMLVTSIMAFLIISNDWGWGLYKTLLIFVPVIVIELIFFFANVKKIGEGGWFPLCFGLVIFIVLKVWKDGREKLSKHFAAIDVSLQSFLKMVHEEDLPKVKHTAVFFTSNPESAPNALLHNLKHNFVIHERMMFVTICFHPTPRIPIQQRVEIEALKNKIYRIKLNFGYMEDPDVPKALELCKDHNLFFSPRNVSYFLSRETIVPKAGKSLWHWQDYVFEFMFRNSTNAAKFFNLPPNRVVELGSRVII